MDIHPFLVRPWLGPCLLVLVYLVHLGAGRLSAWLRARAAEHQATADCGSPAAGSSWRQHWWVPVLVLFTALVLWWLGADTARRPDDATGRAVYEGLLGALLLQQLAFLLQQLLGLPLSYRLVRLRAYEGQMRVAVWAGLESRAERLLEAGALLVVPWVTTKAPFYAGGAVLCVITAVGLLFQARVSRKAGVTVAWCSPPPLEDGDANPRDDAPDSAER